MRVGPRSGIRGVGVAIIALAVACTSVATPTSVSTQPPPTSTGAPVAPATPTLTAEPTLSKPISTPKTPTATLEPTPELEQPTELPTPSPARVVIDLDAVPQVDVNVHSVALEEIVFDTFDGRFTRLTVAPEWLIEQLRDVIQPIYNPEYGSGDDLPWLQDTDLVIGYVSGVSAYAYPIKVLNSRDLVIDEIDEIDGVPVLVSYCPLCASGVVYSREVDGEALLFGNTSALYRSDLVMFDHQTGSYWFQVLGEAVVGQLTGKRLAPLASMTSGWGDWKQLHPETRLLVGDGGVRFGSQHAGNPFGPEYAERLDRGEFPFSVTNERPDARLRASEIVITAEIDSAVKAYPLRLIGEAVVNDEVGGQPVAVFSKGTTGSAFLATVSGMRLTFDVDGGKYADVETDSTWDAFGRAVDGPLRGTSLEPVSSRRAFWFSISGAIPGLELYMP